MNKIADRYTNSVYDIDKMLLQDVGLNNTLAHNTVLPR